MGRRVNEELHREWRDRLERHVGSGLTIARFCEREGVSAASFYAWRGKLAARSRSRSGRAHGKAARGRPVERRSLPIAIGHSRRQPLNGGEWSADAVPLPLPVDRGGTWIELTLHDGTVVRLPAQNLAALELVLATLLGRRANLSGGEVSHA